MKLQIAVDIADTERVLEIAEQVHDIVDIYEVGTPVIMKEGMRPIRALKERYPDLCVLADTKIMDGGALECGDVCKAGADIVTVLALADNATIVEVVETAHRYDRKVLADLICVRDIPERAKELVDMGVDYIGVHTGVDMQKAGRTPLKDLEELVFAVDPARTAVAGGVNIDTIDAYAALETEIIIAGGAICHAENIRQAAMDMKGHIK
ncbi:3-hexulose-6-phosphate synthase [Lachnospiraceae bacterium 38-10]